MNGISALQSGIAGIQTGMSGFQKNAQTIASQSIGTEAGGKNVTDALIDIKANQQQVEASVKVIKAQDAMLGTLLDEMA